MTPEHTPETTAELTTDHDSAATTDRPGPDAPPDRYRAFELHECTVVIHDRENTSAWIECADPVPLGGGLDG